MQCNVCTLYILYRYVINQRGEIYVSRFFPFFLTNAPSFSLSLALSQPPSLSHCYPRPQHQYRPYAAPCCSFIIIHQSRAPFLREIFTFFFHLLRPFFFLFLIFSFSLENCILPSQRSVIRKMMNGIVKGEEDKEEKKKCYLEKYSLKNITQAESDGGSDNETVRTPRTSITQGNLIFNKKKKK